MFLLSLSANAYTVIMKGGRRVEVPAQFVVSEKTLTYEVSPTVQVTLLLDAIDIPATEKANNERPGSLLARKFNDRPSLDQAGAPTLTATKTITNRDLEASMRRRSESEVAYERRRTELGLPSLEESRRKEAAEAERIASELAESRAAQQQSESYWRARASALRTEIATVDAQLVSLRQDLERPEVLVSNGALGFFPVPSLTRFSSFGRHGAFSQPSGRTGIFVAPRGGTQVTAGIRFGGRAARGHVLVNPAAGFRSFGVNSGWRFRSSNTFAVGQGYAVLDERNRLISEFNELSAVRAGLNAQWRELEDEARRAGAPPGWLRP
jgi:hypothetical protein